MFAPIQYAQRLTIAGKGTVHKSTTIGGTLTVTACGLKPRRIVKQADTAETTCERCERVR